MTPGRYFPVGHHVDGHHLSDYLEEADCSLLDADRSRMVDLSSDLTSHHYDFRSSEDSCNYFYYYLCSPLSEIIMMRGQIRTPISQENNQPPRDSQRDDDHQCDDQQ